MLVDAILAILLRKCGDDTPPPLAPTVLLALNVELGVEKRVGEPGSDKRGNR